MTRPFVLHAVLATLPLLLAACDHTHLHARYGVAVRTALQRQVIDPNAGSHVVGAEGLDPQEAAIVLDTYRRSLSPRGDAEAARRSPVMLIQQPAGAAAPQPYGP
jgi:hypothetical protein